MSLLLDALKKAEEAKRQESIDHPADASVRPEVVEPSGENPVDPGAQDTNSGNSTENTNLDLELTLEELDSDVDIPEMTASAVEPDQPDLDGVELSGTTTTEADDPVVDLSIQPVPEANTVSDTPAAGPADPDRFQGHDRGNAGYDTAGTPFGAELENYQSYNRGRIAVIGIVTAVICILAWWHFSRSLDNLNKPTVGPVPPISATKSKVKPGNSKVSGMAANKSTTVNTGRQNGADVAKRPAAGSTTAGKNDALPARNTAPTVSSNTSQSGIIKPSDGVYILGVNSKTGTKKPARGIRIVRSFKAPATEVLIRKAYNAYQSGNLKQAESFYQRVLGTDNTNRDAYLGLAAIAVHRKRFSDAKLLYKKLLELNPKDSVALTGYLAVHQTERSADIRTISDLKFLLKQEPQAAHLHFELGNAYVRHRRWPEAQNAYFRAYNLDQKNADYAFNLAVSLDHIGERRTAVRFYIKALKLSGQRNVGFSRKQIQKRLKQLTGRTYR